MDPEPIFSKDYRLIESYKGFIFNFQNIFPASARVDVIHCLLGIKSGMRTRFISLGKNIDLLEAWCSKFGFFSKYAKINIYDFAYISSERRIIDAMIAVDGSCKPHEKVLGSLLNYPNCCIKKVSDVGELNIDDFEKNLITKSFQGIFQLINPKGYSYGKAFISHVPCCTLCRPSLEIAKRFAKFIYDNKNEKLFYPWVKELKIMNYPRNGD